MSPPMTTDTAPREGESPEEIAMRIVRDWFNDCDTWLPDYERARLIQAILDALVSANARADAAEAEIARLRRLEVVLVEPDNPRNPDGDADRLRNVIALAAADARRNALEEAAGLMETHVCDYGSREDHGVVPLVPISFATPGMKSRAAAIRSLSTGTADGQ